MLQIAYIRDHREEVAERIGKKGFANPAILNTIIALDDERKKLQFEKDELQASVNAASKEIKEHMTAGRKEEGAALRGKVLEIKSSLQPVSERLVTIEKQLQDYLVLLPNMAHASVPRGKSAADNEVVRTQGEIPDKAKTPLPHWDLAAKYHLINFELGNKVTGSGFPFYIGKGAKLQRALIQYFLDYNTTAGYTEYEPPLLVNEDSAFGTGQLPDKEGQMYHAATDNLFLVPTSEVPLTNIYRGEIISADKLPIKMTAYTPCFRREAGSYGKDVRGLNRLHQFDKVEIVEIVHPEESYDRLEKMVEHVEKLLQTLKLPYRILRLCGGDLGFASALTYDFEVYSAAQGKWLEVSSVSNFESFQSHRMKIRYKDRNGKSLLVHTLNGSSLALPRIVAALLENNQSEEGIHIPEVLQKYFGEKVIG